MSLDSAEAQAVRALQRQHFTAEVRYARMELAVNRILDSTRVATQIVVSADRASDAKVQLLAAVIDDIRSAIAEAADK